MHATCPTHPAAGAERRTARLHAQHPGAHPALARTAGRGLPAWGCALAIIRAMPPEVLPADVDLMRAYAAGDVRAFETLYTRHERRLWRFVLRSVGDAATADELAQDVWLRVAQQAERYAPSASRADLPPARFTTWLFTIARNRVVDHLRASRPAHSLSANDDHDEDAPSLADTLAAPSGFGPVRRIENRQQAELLLAAVQALPDDQREAFLLQAEGHMSVQDIAAATGVPFETAKSRLRYARAALRRTLETLA